MTLPPSFEDTGSFGAEIPGTGKAGTFHQSSYDLPNGLRINFTFGHIDRMPKCSHGRVAQFCSCQIHSTSNTQGE